MTTAAPSSHRRRPFRGYIGDSDQDILAFISNLAKQVAAPPLGYGPAAYGLTEDDAASIIAARDAYEPLFQVCATNDRTRPLVIAKNRARDEADRISRRYAQIIKNMPADKVSDQLKFEAGVLIASKRRKSCLTAPSSFPRLYLDVDRTGRGLRQFVRSVWLKFADSSPGMLTDSLRRRMPREEYVTHMILHAEIVAIDVAKGYTKPRFSMKDTSLRVVGYVTRNPYQVKLDASLLAKFGIDIADPTLHSIGIMFCGQWLNARGLVGEIGPARFVNVVMKGSDALKAADQHTLKLAA